MVIGDESSQRESQLALNQVSQNGFDRLIGGQLFFQGVQLLGKCAGAAEQVAQVVFQIRF
jgi:hypothetical protein